MEVEFTSEQEARITRYASKTGKDTAQVVRDAVDLMLSESGFIAGVEKAAGSLDRGVSLEHEEVGRRLKKLLES
jgi:hypothetical protein